MSMLGFLGALLGLGVVADDVHKGNKISREIDRYNAARGYETYHGVQVGYGDWLCKDCKTVKERVMKKTYMYATKFTKEELECIKNMLKNGESKNTEFTRAVLNKVWTQTGEDWRDLDTTGKAHYMVLFNEDTMERLPVK